MRDRDIVPHKGAEQTQRKTAGGEKEEEEGKERGEEVAKAGGNREEVFRRPESRSTKLYERLSIRTASGVYKEAAVPLAAAIVSNYILVSLDTRAHTQHMCIQTHNMPLLQPANQEGLACMLTRRGAACVCVINGVMHTPLHPPPPPAHGREMTLHMHECLCCVLASMFAAHTHTHTPPPVAEERRI